MHFLNGFKELAHVSEEVNSDYFEGIASWGLYSPILKASGLFVGNFTTEATKHSSLPDSSNRVSTCRSSEDF